METKCTNLIDYYNNQPIKNDEKFFQLETTQTFMCNLIRSKLESLGINVQEFDNELVKNNSIVSGSFILQCMIGKFWDNSDIDIFGEITQDSIITKREDIKPTVVQTDIFCPIHKMELYGWKFHNVYPDVSNKDQIPQSTDINFMPEGLGNPNNIYGGIIGYGYSRKYDFEFKKGNPIIYNFIGTRINPVQYVMECFDLSIVRNYYDGKTVQLSYPLHIVNMHARLLRFTDSMNFMYEISDRVKARIKKYEARGFKIKRHRHYECLYEMAKFRNYSYSISRALERNKKLHYKLPFEYKDDTIRLESSNINRIKIETAEYIYKIIKYNKKPFPEFVLLVLEHKEDEQCRNLLSEPVYGLKLILRIFWVREKMNNGVKVNFDYTTKEKKDKNNVKVKHSDYSDIINNQKKLDI